MYTHDLCNDVLDILRSELIIIKVKPIKKLVIQYLNLKNFLSRININVSTLKMF